MGDNILDKLENKLQTNAVLLAIAVLLCMIVYGIGDISKEVKIYAISGAAAIYVAISLESKIVKNIIAYRAIKKIEHYKNIVANRMSKLIKFTEIVNNYSTEDFELQKMENIRVLSNGLMMDASEVKQDIEESTGILCGRVNRELGDLNKAFDYMDKTEKFLVDNNYTGNRKVVKVIHKKFREYAKNIDKWDNDRVLNIEMNIK